MTPEDPDSEAMPATGVSAQASDQIPQTVHAEVDARGLRCPEPLMLARNQMRRLASGEVLYVQATDPTTEHDLTNFCHYLGHTMVHQQARDEAGTQVLEYWLRKA